MAQRILGLIGKGKGPILTIPGHAKQTFACAEGLCENYPVDVHVSSSSGLSTHSLLVDGKIEIPCGSHVQFEYKGERTVLCFLRVS